MDTYLSTYMKDYVWHNKRPIATKGESAEPEPCPHCGCICSECPQPMDEEEEAAAAAPAHEDEACQYLRKVRNRYPFLFQVLSQLPADDMIVRLYRDRLRTAHPSELCEEQGPPAAAKDTGQGGAQAEGPCRCPKPSPCRTEPAEPWQPVLTGRTEYQDTIGATGQRIMVEMLPYRKGKRAHH